VRLTVKQTICLDYLEDTSTTEVLYGGAAGGGKSVIGVYWLIKNCLKYPGTRWLLGREELETLRGTSLKSFFTVAKMQGVYPDVHFRLSGKTIKFVNGSEIILSELKLYPSDPDFDYLGSFEITGAFIDECSQVVHKAKEVVKSRMRFMLNEYKIMPKLLMTCNPAKKWPYIEFYKPNRDGMLTDSKKFVQALPGDNEYLPQAYIDMLKGLDKKTRARLERGEWEYEDDPSSLMAYDDITAIFTNYHVQGTGKRYISADVARFGKDETKIRVWDGFKVIAKTIMSKKNTVEVANKIKDLQITHQVPPSNTVIDEDGIGGGVVDQFPKNSIKGFIANSRPVNPKPNENYENLKSQCAYILADKIKNKEIYEGETNPEYQESLIEDLEQIKAKDPDKDGKRGIISKDRVKEVLGRSPDDGDTYLMRMIFEVSKSGGMRII
jgi:hypothetical protein